LARLLCLITDRARLTAALGAKSGDWPDALAEQVKGAIAGGVDLVQIRERGIEAAMLAGVVRRVVSLARGTRTRVIVNDRLDVALATQADGVHLREDGLPASRARSLAPHALIGRSVHSALAALASADADYVLAGSVYETASKPGQPAALGLPGLRAIVQAVGGRRVVAVGGVTVDNVTEVAATGVSGIAAIGAFVPPQQVPDLASAVQMLTKSLRIGFDSSEGVS
jgi:thiamine-phosphate pyrophosphorylase